MAVITLLLAHPLQGRAAPVRDRRDQGTRSAHRHITLRTLQGTIDVCIRVRRQQADHRGPVAFPIFLRHKPENARTTNWILWTCLQALREFPPQYSRVSRITAILERVLPKCVLEASWDVLIRQPLDCADAGGGTCNHFPFLR